MFAEHRALIVAIFAQLHYAQKVEYAIDFTGNTAYLLSKPLCMENANSVGSHDQVESWMYRVPYERAALLFSLSLILLVGFTLSLINMYVFVTVVLVGIVYVQLQQAQYLGNAIRVHEHQYPEIYEVFRRYATRLNISHAALYIKQDPNLNAFTIGLFKCTVVLNSALVEQMNKKELQFIIGHELGHYKAGHTKISTLLKPLGSNNVFSNFIFGFWDRKAEYSCDRCGLILTKDLDHATSSLIKLSVGKKLYKKLDLRGYVSQVVAADTSSVRLSEMLVDHPLITNRVRNVIQFWKENFIKP